MFKFEREGVDEWGSLTAVKEELWRVGHGKEMGFVFGVKKYCSWWQEADLLLQDNIAKLLIDGECRRNSSGSVSNNLGMEWNKLMSEGLTLIAVGWHKVTSEEERVEHGCYC